MENTSSENDQIVMMGDFNVDQHKDDRMKKIMNNYSFNQLIKESTRVTKDRSTFIDHMYVTNGYNYNAAGVIPLGISDHHLTYIIRKKTKIGSNQHINIKYRDFKHLNENELMQDMRHINWDSVQQQTDVSEMWSAFKDIFLEIVDKHTPFKDRRIKASSEQWINDDILTEMHQRDYLNKKALQHNSDYYWKLYKRSRNLVVSKIREAKRTFVDEP